MNPALSHRRRRLPALLPAWRSACLLGGPLAGLLSCAGAALAQSAPASAATLATAAAAAPALRPALPPADGAAGSRSAVAARAPAPLGCLIDASAVVEVGASVIGLLDSVAVERGDIVRKGQAVAQLESQVERAAVQLAQTKVANQADIHSARAQKDYALKKAERTAALTDLKFVSNQAREQADTEASMADMRLAQALEQQSVAARELQLAKAQLAQRTVLSPLDGVVVERYAAAGERIENRPIARIAMIDPLKVELVLPSSMFGSVKVGQVVQVQPELKGADPRSATVSVVDRVIDGASNTFRVRLALPNPELALPSGVRCKAALGG